jgi:Uma2 family endonuclease
MAERKIKFTYQDYLQLPQERRAELIEGEFFMVPSPSWTHQTVLMKLFLALNSFVMSRAGGEVRFAPLDVVLSPEDVVQPDIVFISRERLFIITEKCIEGAPDLVVEVLSEATAARDRGLKRKLYARYGVREYWLADPAEKSIEVLTLKEEGFETVKVYEQGSNLASPLLEGLHIDLAEIFKS